eukprot:6950263-Pyramimonas_sp.AAC.1
MRSSTFFFFGILDASRISTSRPRGDAQTSCLDMGSGATYRGRNELDNPSCPKRGREEGRGIG